MTHEQLDALCTVDQLVGEIETDLNTLGIHQPLCISQLERFFKLTGSIWLALERVHKSHGAARPPRPDSLQQPRGA
jgi:hypothetical protein